MLDLWLSLVVFAIVATATPGGATALAAASGAQFGFGRSIRLLAGIALGLATLIGAVGGGLGTAVQSFPNLQFGLRIAGSVYVLWLAWTIGRQGAPASKDGTAATPIGFAKGVLLLWLNPKAWTMAAAAGAGYAGLTDEPMHRAILMAATFGSAAGLSLTLWCCGGAWLARVVTTERHWRAINISLSLVLAISIVPMWR